MYVSAADVDENAANQRCLQEEKKEETHKIAG